MINSQYIKMNKYNFISQFCKVELDEKSTS